MLNWILNKLAEKSEILNNYKISTKELIDKISTLNKLVDSLEMTIASNKTDTAKYIDKLHVTSHAIHRYRERHKGKGTDKEISDMLFKLLLEQLRSMDTLPDGEYVLKRGVVGVIVQDTLVTIIPKRSAVAVPKLR